MNEFQSSIQPQLEDCLSQSYLLFLCLLFQKPQCIQYVKRTWPTQPVSLYSPTAHKIMHECALDYKEQAKSRLACICTSNMSSLSSQIVMGKQQHNARIILFLIFAQCMFILMRYKQGVARLFYIVHNVSDKSSCFAASLT